MLSIPVAFLLGACVGIMSGALGFGGAILLIPILLAVVPALGGPVFSSHDVAAIAAMMSLAATATAVWVHARHRRVSLPLVLVTASAALLSGFLGGVASAYLSQLALLRVLFVVVMIGLVMLILPRKRDLDEPDQPPPFSKPGAFGIGAAVGFIGGMTGAPGGFLYIPALTYLLKLPLRVVVGSSIGIALLTSIASTIGKAVTGQVPWETAIPVAVGSAISGRIGAILSNRASIHRLRIVILIVIFISAMQIGVRAWL